MSTAVVALTMLGITAGAKRGVLTLRPLSLRVSVLGQAIIAEATCEAPAVDTWAVESPHITSCEDLHFTLASPIHGCLNSSRSGQRPDGTNAKELAPMSYR